MLKPWSPAALTLALIATPSFAGEVDREIHVPAGEGGQCFVGTGRAAGGVSGLLEQEAERGGDRFVVVDEKDHRH